MVGTSPGQWSVRVQVSGRYESRSVVGTSPGQWSVRVQVSGRYESRSVVGTSPGQWSVRVQVSGRYESRSVVGTSPGQWSVRVQVSGRYESRSVVGTSPGQWSVRVQVSGRYESRSVVGTSPVLGRVRIYICFPRSSVDIGVCFSFEDIACLADSLSITEVSLDGNPCAQDPQYRAQVLGHLGRLRQLDMKKVSVSVAAHACLSAISTLTMDMYILTLDIHTLTMDIQRSVVCHCNCVYQYVQRCAVPMHHRFQHLLCRFNEIWLNMKLFILVVFSCSLFVFVLNTSILHTLGLLTLDEGLGLGLILSSHPQFLGYC